MNSTPSSSNVKLQLASQIRAELERRKQRRDLTEECRKSLRSFIREAWPIVEPAKAYLHNWHIDAIADHLQAVTEGQIKNLLINIPPGHAKSLLVSVLWPAWVWAINPTWRSLFGSYGAGLAIRDSVRCRSLIDSEWYQETFTPDWGFSKDENQKAYYKNSASGFRYSLGVGSSATGWRGNAVVVDDPLNAKDQFSDAALEECVFWWDQVMSSRLNDLSTGNKIIIMQRLSERDLSQHVLTQGGYEHLCLPTEFEPEKRSVTCIGFSDPRAIEGELLFPALFPAEVIADVKRVLGPRGYAGQHQQRPSPGEGGMFKRHAWRYWKLAGMNLPPITVRLPDGSYQHIEAEILPEPNLLDIVIQSWDMAFKGLETSDYVVGQIWAAKGANRYLLDQVRDQMSFTQTENAVKALSYQHPVATRKLVEDKANGPAIIDKLNNQIGGMIACNPDGSKYARAYAISPLVDAGNVFLPHPLMFPWVTGFIEECAVFANGAHDDQVDAMSQGLRYLIEVSQFFCLVA